MNAECMKDVVRFDKLPDTIEKMDIEVEYLNDRLTSLEFYGEVRKYLAKIDGEV